MNTLRAWGTALFTLTFVVSPAFTTFTGFEANQLPIPQIDPPIQPAGYAFSIWGLIYGWLIVSAVYGLLFRRDDSSWDAARTPLIVSLVIGTPWLWVATQNAVLATFMIIAMALTAIAAFLRAPTLDRWRLQLPLGLYSGWLTAASCVSLGSTAAGYGIVFESFGWAVIGIVIALLATLTVSRQRSKAPEYPLTVVWALVGIIVANIEQNQTILMLAALGVTVLLLATFRNHRKPAR